jgi:hypothetical protein
MGMEALLNDELAFHTEVVNAKYDARIDALRAKFEAIKLVLLTTHQELLDDPKENNENASETINSSSIKAFAASVHNTVDGRTIDPNLPLIRVTCIKVQEAYDKPYLNREWILQPTYNKACKIGRNANLHYKNKGISLQHDPEVSVSHGQFGISNKTDKLFYMDVGSRNGSIKVSPKSLNETLLPPHVEHVLTAGFMLRVGGLFLQITLT